MVETRDLFFLLNSLIQNNCFASVKVPSITKTLKQNQNPSKNKIKTAILATGTLSTTTSLILQYMREYGLLRLGLSGLQWSRPHSPPHQPLFALPPPPFLLPLHIDNLSVCFVWLPSYTAHLCKKKKKKKISRLKFEVVAERMLVFDECQTRGFIMYHQLNSISFISALFHRG